MKTETTKTVWVLWIGTRVVAEYATEAEAREWMALFAGSQGGGYWLSTR